MTGEATPDIGDLHPVPGYRVDASGLYAPAWSQENVNPTDLCACGVIAHGRDGQGRSWTTRLTVPGMSKRVRVYAVRQDIFEYDCEDHSADSPAA